ncbi:MAG: ATP-binding protein [Bacteroidota bacterium]
MLKDLFNPDLSSLQKENKILQRQLASLEEKERHLSVINGFATAILQQHTVEEIAWTITREAISKLGFEDCIVYLLDEGKEVLVQTAAHGPKNPQGFEIRNPIVIPVGQGIVGSVAQSGKPEIIYDTSKDKRYIPDDMIRLSELAVPIKFEERVIGVIDSEHTSARFFNQEHLYLLETIAAMTASRLLHAQAQERLRTYQRQLEQQVVQKTTHLTETVHKLQRTNEDLEAFAHAASHDLREPIRTIASFLRLIQRRSGESIEPEIEEYLNFAIDGATRMNQLLNGLLAYAQLSDINLNKTEVDLNEVMQACLDDLSHNIKVNQATITYPELPSLKGYPTLLQQLLQNLLANAIKFRRQDILPSIKLSWKLTGDHYQFQVEDNGIGVAPEFADRIFNLYTRLNKRQEYSGTGLGLSICKKIVEKHGGSIHASNTEDGQGACFTFTLPT